MPDEFARLNAEPGPFASVYLDATRSTEAGAREVQLRWRQLRDSLVAAGTDGATLTALDEVAGGTLDASGPHGQVLIAAHGQVLLDDVLPAPPVRQFARWSPLPQLMAYLAQRGPRVPRVVVVADHTGADITTVVGRTTEVEQVVGSQQYPLHKTSTANWSERHFQNRVDNAVETNVREVAAEVARAVAAAAAELVVIAGDERARGSLVADLARLLPVPVEIADVGAGGRGAGSSPDALDAQVRDAVLRHTWAVRRELLEHLRQNLGRRSFAVAGVAAVLDAVRKAQAEQVVISDDPSSTVLAWIGPEPLQLALTQQELIDMGVPRPQHERFDAALVRAVLGSGAQLVITPNAHHYLPDGIAALLRYDDADTP